MMLLISQFIHRGHETRISGFKKYTSNKKNKDASIWSTALMMTKGKNKKDEEGNTD